MEILGQLVQNIEALMGLPMAVNHHLGFIYICSAIVISFIVYLRAERKADKHLLRGFLSYCLPRHIWTHASTKIDIGYFFINSTVGLALMAPFFVSSNLVALNTASMLEFLFGVMDSGMPVNIYSQVVMAFCAVLAADLGFYLSHYLFHKVDILWEFHKVHHSAQVLTPITAHRSHPCQTIVNRTFSGVGIGLVMGMFDYIYAYNIDPLTYVGINVFSICYLMFSSNLQHSHVWWSYGPILSKIFISPAQHQIHHSCAIIHRDKNMGSGFAIWDNLFGTLYIPNKKEELVLGLGNGGENEYSSVWRLYMLPFYKAFRLIRCRISYKGLESRTVN